MNNRATIICRDAAELSRKAAQRFAELARQAIDARGRFSVALAGGSTPKALYSLLASGTFSEQLAWRQIHLFWGDERCVPPDHAESNFRMVQEALLAQIVIPIDNVQRMAGENVPSVAAAEYEAQLRKHFHVDNDAWPRFDLILLGLGEDGHTASLFPRSSALQDQQHWVAATYVEKLNAHRLTLTLPAINYAREIFFLVAGQSKAAIVREVLQAKKRDCPAAQIQPTRGQLTWFITQDAAPAAISQSGAD